MAVSKLNPVSGGVTQKVQEFTATGSFVTPSNCSAIEILLVGGGGGGGSARCNTGNKNGGGGGAGGQVRKQSLVVTPGTTYTVTIGAGGAGGTSAGAGAKGSDSTFGALLTAMGGSPGGGSSDVTPGTYANTTINSGWNVGGPSAGNDQLYLLTNAAGGSGGPATLQGSFAASSYNMYLSPGATGVLNGYQSIGMGGTFYSQQTMVLYGGAAVDGLYGGGGCGPWQGNTTSHGVGYKNVFPGPNAGSGGNYSTSGVTTTGTAGTANFGGGGGGAAVFQAVATTADGGAGGSGYCLVTYWS